ncbi:MAG TPA: PQQ-dependent dehydrogenase, methanol/ethanol family [Steroidobacteraceae bacterium]|nr:PQQ-dependent dehydrogenase, methanol/ethanol family [Steroidobacteraceae bacterium]
MPRSPGYAVSILAALLTAGPALTARAAGKAAAVTPERMENADKDTANWMSHGRTWGEQRFSPLAQINDRNVQKLGLAWFADIGTYRGVVATPLVIDGVLYNISAWDVTTAYNAATGKVLWTYDPKITPQAGAVACCGPVSRGLAAWKGKLFIGALNAHLIALDAKTGKVLWDTDTSDPGQPISITGAPRVTKDGLVVIGNGGGDLGARGYMNAFDAETGKLVWKFYIVPGDPSKPDGVASDSIMPMAMKTWSGEWWKTGGGGNNWDGIVYDPKLDIVYFGTGNGSPHPQAFRSPGGGDNLFIGSIVAVNAKTGKYVWHYQEVPGEQWDYDSTSPLILADLKIDGRDRQVIMHAPKNGFFYVLDRATGELLSAQNFVPNTWASHVDIKTGRPAINPEAMVTVEPRLITPNTAHNWNPMSYSPLTGLVYIPVQEQWMVISRIEDGKFQFRLGRTTIGSGTANPELRRQFNQRVNTEDKGYTLAWDPVTQKERYRIVSPFHFQGGALTTAGNLLVQGTMRRTLAIYRADNGEKLWEAPTVSVPVAGPITYSVNGTQYIAVNAGWNNAIVHGLNAGPEPFSVGPAKLVVYKLGAKGVTLPPAPAPEAVSPPPGAPQAAEKVAAGEKVFAQFCSTCHGQSAIGAGAKDLRFIKPQSHTDFNDIVLGGKFKEKGMAPFNGVLTQDQVDAVHAYIISRGQEDWQPVFVPQPPRR